MQGIDTRELRELDEKLSDLLKRMPEKRRGLHERLGTEAKALVDSAIGGEGTVQGWQEKHIGSRGGYAAIRPKKGYVSTKKGKTYAYGYITNALENGHRTRGPSGTAKRHRLTRAEHVSVSGKHFYSAARTNLETKALKLAEEFLDEAARELEG